MSEKRGKNYTAQEKVSILKQHFAEKKAISDLCDEYKIHPSIFYRWQQKFFENAVSVFENKREKPNTLIMKKVAELEDKLVRKNEVLSELMEEHVALKKTLGGS